MLHCFSARLGKEAQAEVEAEAEAAETTEEARKAVQAQLATTKVGF